MIQKLKFIYSLVVFIGIYSCSVMTRKEKISSYTFSAEGYTVKPYQCNNCTDTIRRDFVFEIKHSSTHVDLSKFKIFILLNGKSIYTGNFKKKIVINGICHCNENNLSSVNTISFIAIDPLSQLGYVWDKKQSFYMSKYRKANVLLVGNSSENGYKIRFDNMVFYR